MLEVGVTNTYGSTNTLLELISWVMVLITAGFSARVLFILLLIMFNPDEKIAYLKRVKNLIIAVIIGFSITTVVSIINHYFS